VSIDAKGEGGVAMAEPPAHRDNVWAGSE
jgi:hypothetical protein